MKLIFPSRLDYYSFRIRPMASTESMLKLRLEFDSWIIRLFAPHLSIAYDKKKRKIVEYFGPSNILTDKGEIQNVYIFYEWLRWRYPEWSLTNYERTYLVMDSFPGL